VQHANDFDAFVFRPVENGVFANVRAAKVWSKLLPWTSHARHLRECPAFLFNGVDETVRGPGVVGGNEIGDFIKIPPCLRGQPISPDLC